MRRLSENKDAIYGFLSQGICTGQLPPRQTFSNSRRIKQVFPISQRGGEGAMDDVLLLLRVAILVTNCPAATHHTARIVLLPLLQRTCDVAERAEGELELQLDCFEGSNVGLEAGGESRRFEVSEDEIFSST